jgi:hypothetical protein
MRRSFWPPSGCTLKKGPPIQRPSSTRGNRRARKSAAHNLNDTIAVGALIQIKTPQMALFRVTEVTANVVTSNYDWSAGWLIMPTQLYPQEKCEAQAETQTLITIVLVWFIICLGMLVLLFADQSFSKAAIELMCLF